MFVVSTCKMSRFAEICLRCRVQLRICLEGSRRYAGHSKWANIKHIKASKDSQKAVLFCRLNRQLRLAVQEGGSPDPNLNSRLHQVVEQAKRLSMPMSSIQNAIKLAASSKENTTKEYLLEISGPGGSLILVVLLTDNFVKAKYEITPLVRKSRVASLSEGSRWRHTFDLGSVVEVLKPADVSLETAVDHAIHVGAEDVNMVNDDDTTLLQFSCAMGQTRQVEAELSKLGYKVHFSGQKYMPRSFVELQETDMEALSGMYHKIEEYPDVIAIYDNIA